MFITFEGVEGSGKSTQIQLIKQFFEAKNQKVLLTKEPGGSNLGIKLRDLILNPYQDDKPKDLTELLLYIADRAHHVETVIKPALENNIIVLSDRYTDSTTAYQGYARGFDLKDIEYLNSIATKNLKPNLTVILDLDPLEGITRIIERRGKDSLDRLEQEKIDFHKKVRTGFLELAKKEPNRIKIYDATKEIEEIHKEIIDDITKCFQEIESK